MSIQRLTRQGSVRYRARVKWQGREVATRVFERKRDAEAWEREQTRALHAGDWFDPRRGKVTLASIVPEWQQSRETLKRKTREADASAYERHIRARFGAVPLASITQAQVATWVGGLVAGGCAPSTAARYLATLRSILEFGVADGRLVRNVAAGVKVPGGGSKSRREGQFLTVDELMELANVAQGRYADVILVLGLCGLRWGELAGLQVGDRIAVPGQGLRLQRAVLASSARGELYVDTLKGRRNRTVPLPPDVVPIIERWSRGKVPTAWLFEAPEGGPLSESNWRRSVRWTACITAIGRLGLRPHDLRHTAASLWLAAGADPKVVQRILGHASAAMTMHLYGHLVGRNLWQASSLVALPTNDHREEHEAR